MSVKCPAGNVTHELGLRTHKKEKVINEESVKQRLILRKLCFTVRILREKGCAKFVRNAVRISKRSSASCNLKVYPRMCGHFSFVQNVVYRYQSDVESLAANFLHLFLQHECAQAWIVRTLLAHVLQRCNHSPAR